MKTPYSTFGVLFASLSLAACAPNTVPSSAPGASSGDLSRGHAAVPAGKNSPTLYVLNSGGGRAFGVTVYSSGGSSLLRTLSLGEYNDGFTVDPMGNLYAGFPPDQADGGHTGGPDLLKIYTNKGGKVMRTLHQPHPFGLLTLDDSGNLFTLCAADRLCEYADAKQHVIRRIALRHFNTGGSALAADISGNLAIDSPNGPILVFAPGATQPSWTFTTGIDNSTFLAFDSSGDLYAANLGQHDEDAGSVTVYAKGISSPIRTITNGIAKPSALAFDSAGNLYVLNACALNSSDECVQTPAVTVYAPGGSSPIRTITNGVEGSGGLALDPSGNLYVANEGYKYKSPPDPGSITVYAPGETSPIRTVKDSIQYPTALGIGP